jgi:hypothetical protein
VRVEGLVAVAVASERSNPLHHQQEVEQLLQPATAPHAPHNTQNKTAQHNTQAGRWAGMHAYATGTDGRKAAAAGNKSTGYNFDPIMKQSPHTKVVKSCL